MKRYLLLTVIALTAFTLQAQDATDYTPDKRVTEGNLFTERELPSPLSPVRFNMETGMSFGTFGHGNFLQTYVNPAFSMPLNKKWSILAGVSYSHTILNNTPLLFNTGEIRQHSGELNTLTIHSSGIYRMNDKLTMSGAVYKTVNPALDSRLNPNAINMEAQGVAFGIGYQLNENFFIGASVKMQQGNSNFNSWYPSPYRSTFNNGPTNTFNSFGTPGGF